MGKGLFSFYSVMLHEAGRLAYVCHVAFSRSKIRVLAEEAVSTLHLYLVRPQLFQVLVRGSDGRKSRGHLKYHIRNHCRFSQTPPLYLLPRSSGCPACPRGEGCPDEASANTPCFSAASCPLFFC